MRSPVAERGSRRSSRPRSSRVGTTFSMPMTVTSSGGSVVHMRPLPSFSTTQTVPVSATPTLAPVTPMPARRKRSRRYRRETSASSRGSSERSLPARDRAQEEVADLAAAVVDGRHQDVGRGVAGQLHDELGQVGLDGLDAGRRERGVEADLVGGQRLHLDQLGDAVVAGDAGDDGVGGRRVRRAVHARAGGLGGRLELVQQLVEAVERVVLDAPRLLAELLEVGQLRDGRGAAGADRLRRARAGWRAAARRRAPRAPPPGSRAAPVGCAAGSSPRSSAARMSARCTALTVGAHAGSARRRCSAGTTGPRPSRTSAPVATMFAHLSASIASETSAFLIEKVPPKPQHSAASGSSSSSSPRTCASSRCGASPTRVTRCEWQVGCSVTRRGNDAPTSSTPRRRTRNSESSKSLPPSASASRASRSSPGLARHSRQQLAHPAHARRRRRDDRVHAVVPAHHVHEPPRQPQRVVPVAAVDVHLAAAGLRRPGTPTSCPSRSSTRTTERPVSGNSVSATQVMKTATLTRLSVSQLRGCGARRLRRRSARPAPRSQSRSQPRHVVQGANAVRPRAVSRMLSPPRDWNTPWPSSPTAVPTSASASPTTTP